MHFCKCENMYYIRLDDENDIISSIIVENVVMKKQTSRKKICAYQRFNLDEVNNV